MLARITYGVVAVAFATLIAGFFQRSSNALLYVSIVLSVLAIVLVLIGAARRAREVPIAEPTGPSMAEEPASLTMEEPAAAGVLSSLDDDDLDDDDLEEVTAPRSRSTTTRRAPASRAATRTTSRPAASRGTSRTTAARSTAASRSKAPAKVLVVPGRDRYHASGCRFIVDKPDVEEISAATAKRRGYQRCSVCKPE